MNKDDRAHARQLYEASALAFMFPLAIGIGFLWGYGMDKFFGTWPWLSIIFSIFGIVAAFINLFRIGLRNNVPPGDSSKPRT